MGKFIGCYFKFGHMIREKMIFKDISYLELLSPFCSAERKICIILVEDIIRNKSVNYFDCLFCCFTSKVNSYGHCGTVSSTNHTFFLGRLEQAVNQ